MANLVASLSIKHELLNALQGHLVFEIYCHRLHTCAVMTRQSVDGHDLANAQQCRILYHKQNTCKAAFHCECSCDLEMLLLRKTSWNRSCNQKAQLFHSAHESALQCVSCSFLLL